MKSSNKNIASNMKKPPFNHTLRAFYSNQNHRNLSSERSRHSQTNNFIDDFTQFHLNDEQPQSLNAKRKLEEFSVQIQRKNQVIDTHKRNEQTINLLKKSQKLIPSQQNSGWIQNQHQNKKVKYEHNKSKQNRIQSEPRSDQFRQTLKYKHWAQFNKYSKKYSLNAKPNSPKINLSFNNLIPEDLQTVRQIQMSKQVVKRAKSQHGNRPSTASYYGASPNILTLFDKETPINCKNSQTVRIHSGNKESDNAKSRTPITFKNKDNFLKTSSFKNIYHQSKKLIRKQSQKRKMTIQQGNQTLNIQTTRQLNNESRKKSIHARSSSQPSQSISLQNKKNVLSHPFRKNMILREKKNAVMNKKIKSHQLFVIKDQNDQTKTQRQTVKQHNSTKSLKNKENMQLNKIQLSEIAFNENKKSQTRHGSLVKPTKKLSKQSITPPSNSNLDSDFTLLVNMLKKESQHVLGGQLHSYLTQMNKNFQYSYYFSKSINAKKNQKDQRKSNILRTKTLQSQQIEPTEKKQIFLGQQKVTKNNTTLHYTSFSSSKHKSREHPSLRSTSSSNLQV